MATTNPNMAIERAAEVRDLASAVFSETYGLCWEDALDEAQRQVDELLQFAAAWDAQAVAPTIASIDAITPTDDAVPEPIYIPSALDPHEARAVDKAMYERARGIVPQLVGRFWFVPSRTTGGTVYRVTEHECTCEAGQHGRYCWHRALIGLERELAA